MLCYRRRTCQTFRKLKPKNNLCKRPHSNFKYHSSPNSQKYMIMILEKLAQIFYYVWNKELKRLVIYLFFINSRRCCGRTRRSQTRDQHPRHLSPVLLSNFCITLSLVPVHHIEGAVMGHLRWRGHGHLEAGNVTPGVGLEVKPLQTSPNCPSSRSPPSLRQSTHSRAPINKNFRSKMAELTTC